MMKLGNVLISMPTIVMIKKQPILLETAFVLRGVGKRKNDCGFRLACLLVCYSGQNMYMVASLGGFLQ